MASWDSLPHDVLRVIQACICKGGFKDVIAMRSVSSQWRECSRWLRELDFEEGKCIIHGIRRSKDFCSCMHISLSSVLPSLHGISRLRLRGDWGLHRVLESSGGFMCFRDTLEILELEVAYINQPKEKTLIRYMFETIRYFTRLSVLKLELPFYWESCLDQDGIQLVLVGCVALRNLRQLHLVNVPVNRIVGFCKSLEVLSVCIKSNGTREFVLKVPNLRSFSMDYPRPPGNMAWIHLDAPRLEFLALRGPFVMLLKGGKLLREITLEDTMHLKLTNAPTNVTLVLRGRIPPPRCFDFDPVTKGLHLVLETEYPLHKFELLQRFRGLELLTTRARLFQFHDWVNVKGDELASLRQLTIKLHSSEVEIIRNLLQFCSSRLEKLVLVMLSPLRDAADCEAFVSKLKVHTGSLPIHYVIR